MHSAPTPGFLTDDALPFVGRTLELARIVAFWRSTVDSQELRTALLIGQAGVGKSRLCQEAVAVIRSERGVVVHLKLYPDSATTLAPLLAQSLAYTNTDHGLLKSVPDGTIPSALSALRHLCRLRPTLLLIEDIHLLHRDSIPELTVLLDSVADESLAVLCTARPVELPARGVISRWMVYEALLKGLTPNAVNALAEKLFGDALTIDQLETLHNATGGNPFALRSALRGATRQKYLDRDSGGRWKAEEGFETVVKRSTVSIAEGMVAHLSARERADASLLSCLGEVFSREAARMLVSDADQLIHRLCQQNILSQAFVTASPLPTLPESADTPLAFTHSLLHAELLRTQAAPTRSLLHLISQPVPIYSMIPFELAGAGLIQEDLRYDQWRTTLMILLNIARALDGTSDWQLGPKALHVAERLYALNAADSDAIEYLELLSAKLHLIRRRNTLPEYERWIGDILQKAESLHSPQGAIYALTGLSYLAWSQAVVSERGPIHFVLDKARDILQQYPDLRFTVIYVDLLSRYRNAAWDSKDDREVLRAVEAEFTQIMNSEACPQDVRDFAYVRIGSALLESFDAEEELQNRWQLYRQLSAMDHKSNLVAIRQTYFLATVGHIYDLKQQIESYNDDLQDFGYRKAHYGNRVLLLWADAMTQGQLSQVLKEAGALLHKVPIDIVDNMRTRVWYNLIVAGLYRRDFAWVQQIVQEYNVQAQQLLPDWRLAIALHDNDTATLAALLVDESLPSHYKPLLQAALGAGTTADTVTAAKAILTAPLLRLEQLLQITIAIDALNRASAFDPPVPVPCIQEMQDAVVSLLAWLTEKDLSLLIEAYCRDYSAILSKQNSDLYTKKAEAIAESRQALLQEDSGSHGDNRLHIRLFGRIEAPDPDNKEMAPIKGNRVRTLLGVLVALEIIRIPLERSKFYLLVADKADGVPETDPEKVRKQTNATVLRLRVQIGTQSVLTTDTPDGIPRLNLQQCRVDVLEAHTYLNEARAALRNGKLLTAKPAILSALQLWNAEVMFPALYDEFFESLREEFEILIRSTVLRIASALENEGDVSGAEEVLTLLNRMMPEDEEVAQILSDVFEKSGKLQERLRLKRNVAVP